MEKAQQKNPTRSALVAQVVDIIFTALNLRHVDRNTVNEDTILVKGGLNLDSIDILELIVNFETTFGIKFSESEAHTQHFRNIGSVVDFIQLKKVSL